MYLQTKERKLSNNEKAFSLIVCELNDKSDRFMAIWQMLDDLSENYLMFFSTWPMPKGYPTTAYDCLMTVLQLPDDCPTTVWQLPVDCLMTARQLPDDCLMTAWRLPDDCLTAAIWLPKYCLMASLPHYITFFALKLEWEERQNNDKKG